MPRIRHLPLPIITATLIVAGVAWVAVAPVFRSTPAAASAFDQAATAGADQQQSVSRINRLMEDRWRRDGLTPADTADELLLFRRLSLALLGTAPALEEVRAFLADEAPYRLQRWTANWLRDRRFGDYFAERLAVGFVGDRRQQPPWFGRDRFQGWLSEQLLARRPYHEIVGEMISETGPPTSRSAANFITAETTQGEMYASRLAARSVRAFLGQRIDCAECHDHPFDHWRRDDFHGLAACFAQAETRPGGLADNPNLRHEVEDRKTLIKNVFEPRVPFHEEWLGASGPPRARFAGWVTHPDNRRFRRAIANRVWGLMFGRPLISPVDSIPDPPETNAPAASPDRADSQVDRDALEVLDALADVLRDHGDDLRRLLAVIVSSRPYRLASTHVAMDSDAECDRLTRAFAVFPLTPLRPEQVGRSLQQAASLAVLGPRPNVVARVRRLQWEIRFLDEYGSLGEHEFDERAETIPQTMQRLHGRYVAEKARADWLASAGRIAAMSPDEATCLEACYLVCLTRLPEPEEREHFLPQIRSAKGAKRRRIVEDVFWTLLNSPEFSWNH